MSSGFWPTSTPELAEAARIEMDGARATDFLEWAMAGLQLELSREGLEVRTPTLQVADRLPGGACRRSIGELVTQGGESTGLQVSARLTAILSQMGPHAMSLSLQFIAEGDGQQAVPLLFPVLTGVPVRAKLNRPAGASASTGFMLREAMTTLAEKCEARPDHQVASLFCANLTEGLEP